MPPAKARQLANFCAARPGQEALLAQVLHQCAAQRIPVELTLRFKDDQRAVQLLSIVVESGGVAGLKLQRRCPFDHFGTNSGPAQLLARLLTDPRLLPLDTLALANTRLAPEAAALLGASLANACALSTLVLGQHATGRIVDLPRLVQQATGCPHLDKLDLTLARQFDIYLMGQVSRLLGVHCGNSQVSHLAFRCDVHSVRSTLLRALAAKGRECPVLTLELKEHAGPWGWPHQEAREFMQACHAMATQTSLVSLSLAGLRMQPAAGGATETSKPLLPDNKWLLRVRPRRDRDIWMERLVAIARRNLGDWSWECELEAGAMRFVGKVGHARTGAPWPNDLGRRIVHELQARHPEADRDLASLGSVDKASYAIVARARSERVARIIAAALQEGDLTGVRRLAKGLAQNHIGLDQAAIDELERHVDTEEKRALVKGLPRSAAEAPRLQLMYGQTLPV